MIFLQDDDDFFSFLQGNLDETTVLDALTGSTSADDPAGFISPLGGSDLLGAIENLSGGAVIEGFRSQTIDVDSLIGDLSTAISTDQLGILSGRRTKGRGTSSRGVGSDSDDLEPIIKQMVLSNLKEKEPELSVSELVAAELHALICTNSKKYAAVRTQSKQMFSKHSQTAILSAIAAAVGASLGLAAVIVMPFVAVGLLVVLRVSREVYCAKCRPRGTVAVVTP